LWAGRCRIVRLLGTGGMGTVYEAEQDSPRRAVALKVVRPGLASLALQERFANEAKILGRLHHQGIAQVHEAGITDDGQPFFAMELIRGQPLDEYARRQRLDAAARLALMARVCDAVQHAHDRGVIHRDLKPGNILVDETGQPKVFDFGVARATDADLRASAALTQTGQLLGTPRYMSPEQVTGDLAALDGRSDVYALGLILFELLADRLPYHLDNLPLPEMARVIREQEPSRLGSVNTAFRDDVETIVAKALEKDRGRRYASAGALAADIRRHLTNEPILARPPSALYHLRKLARRHKALVSGALGVILALVVGLVGTILFAVRAEHSAQVAQEEGRLAGYQTYLARLAAAGRALQNHDVAEAARQLDQAPEELRGWEWRHLGSRLDDSSAVLPVPAESLVFLLDAPDGPWEGTTAPDARVTDADGPERLTFSLVPGPYASLVRVRDETWVADNAGPRAMRLRDATGRVRCLFEEPDCAEPSGVVFSPDGARAAVSWKRTAGGNRASPSTTPPPARGRRPAARTRGASGASRSAGTAGCWPRAARTAGPASRTRRRERWSPRCAATRPRSTGRSSGRTGPGC
jgi:predicted Ser/Thr protein kinase